MSTFKWLHFHCVYSVCHILVIINVSLLFRILTGSLPSPCFCAGAVANVAERGTFWVAPPCTYGQLDECLSCSDLHKERGIYEGWRDCHNFTRDISMFSSYKITKTSMWYDRQCNTHISMWHHRWCDTHTSMWYDKYLQKTIIQRMWHSQQYVLWQCNTHAMYVI